MFEKKATIEVNLVNLEAAEKETEAENKSFRIGRR